MRNNIALILLLMCKCMLVTSRSIKEDTDGTIDRALYEDSSPKHDSALNSQDKVISVRITSSVAVGRGRGRLKKFDNNLNAINHTRTNPPVTQKLTSPIETTWTTNTETIPTELTETPTPGGANLEFIKQLNSKKEARGLSNFERIHSFPSYFDDNLNDSVPEASVKSIFEIEKDDEIIRQNENNVNVPLARSIPLGESSNNLIQDLTRRPISDSSNPKLTTVSFNIVHETPKVTSNYNTASESYTSSLSHTETPQPKEQENHHKPAKIYSEPSKIYSEPAKFYSEPAKIYSEPAKVYGEPAKVYGEPAKIYGEPSKFYSQPASLNLPRKLQPKLSLPVQFSQSPDMTSSTTMATTPVTTASSLMKQRLQLDHLPEKNYEVDEKISVLTEGRSHGVQESSTERCKQENCKVGYVVEGRQYRKYRVEEKTSDGFIVGEYGVVRNEDGALRGVRYTADSDASPRLIYDALMKFLQLK